MARPVKRTPDQWNQDILSAAQSLFITKGYEETSVDDIMECVGGSKGMFYHSFQSKEELFNVLVDTWAEQYAKAITNVLYNSKISFSEKFINILDVIQQMAQKSEGLEVFFTDKNLFITKKLSEEMIAKLVPPLSSALKDGIAEGTLSIENTNFYANYIICGSLGALNYGDGAPKEKIPKNLSYLPQIIADTLRINVTTLLNQKSEKGRERNE